MKDHFEGKTVVLTGICGSVGREILRQLSKTNVKNIVGLDINENEIFHLKNRYSDDDRVSICLGSVRDKDTLRERFRGAQIVLHTAALKHVGVCEESPQDAVLTNIIGTNNLIGAAAEAGVERVLFTSSDKAVNPTSVMGTSKLMGERLVTAAMGDGSISRPIMASTRFGNVLGSKGSVVPIFKQQIEAGGPVRLTSEKMSRFVMTMEEAVRLVLRSVFLAIGGEVFVTKMPAVRIADLAQAMIEILAPGEDIKVEIIGTRPGEKIYEELFNDEEMRRTIEIDDYFVIKPALFKNQNNIDKAYATAHSTQVDQPYNSAKFPVLSVQQIKKYLVSRGVLIRP